VIAVPSQLQAMNSIAARLATAAATGIAIALILASILQARENLRGTEAGDQLVGEVWTTQLMAERLLSTLKDAETGQRGYLITGDPAYLEPYYAAWARLDADLGNLEATPLTDPETTRLIGRIKILARAKLEDLRNTVALGQSGQLEAAVAIVRTNAGKALMDEIRAEVAAIGVFAEAKIAEARARRASALHWAEVVGLGALASVLLGGVALTQRLARVHAATSLRRLERFTRAFGLTQGMMHGLDGRITFWGRGAEWLYGYRQKDALDQISYRLLDARLPAPLSEIETALRRDGHWHGELTYRRRDGSDIHVASYWALHLGEAGEEDAVIEVGNDITALKRAEAALRENALRLRLALDASALGIWHWHVDGANVRLEWDERCRALFFLPPEAPVDYAVWLGAVAVEDRAMVTAKMARALNPADPDDQYLSEYRARHSDGTTTWLMATGRALFEPDQGAPSGRRAVRILGTVRDVSRTKQAEQNQRQADALLRTIVEAAPGLIYAKDRDGRFLVANKAAIDLFGGHWATLQGRTDLELLRDRAQAEAVMANDLRIMELGESEAFEEIMGGDGRVWFSTKAPLRDENSALLGLVGLSVDITERKRDENRLRQMVNELNHRVKNTLATVQAIASQSLRGTDPAVWQALEGRLLALAAVHDVLTRESWVGAGLHEVVAGALAPHGGIDDVRFVVSGPPLILRPSAVLSLVLGLHELTTNSVRYGALSAATGRVEIRWNIVRGTIPLLRLTWTERGGPPVVQTVRPGFGTWLIKRGMAQDLRGTVRLGFDDPAGVVCSVEAPLTEVAASASVVPLPSLGRV
jgi:PAS domain S-box-containing protein